MSKRRYRWGRCIFIHAQVRFSTIYYYYYYSYRDIVYTRYTYVIYYTIIYVKHKRWQMILTFLVAKTIRNCFVVVCFLRVAQYYEKHIFKCK